MKYLTYLGGLILLLLTFTTNVHAGNSSCPDCGAPEVLRSVACELVSVRFLQPENSGGGHVAIRLYDAAGVIIYDRYSEDRAYFKQEDDTYRICRNTVAKARRMSITRCIPSVAKPVGFEGNILAVFRASMHEPIKLP